MDDWTTKQKYARQNAAYAAMQGPQKKRRAIKQQVYMQKNNLVPSMRPQCTGAYTELHR